MSSHHKRKGRSRQYFHRVARRSNLGAIVEGADGSDDEDGSRGEEVNDFLTTKIRCKLSGPEHKQRLNRMKAEVIAQLSESGGDPAAAKDMIDRLTSIYDPSSFDPKQFMTPVTMTDAKLEDMWLMISKPEFKDCLGKNESGDGMYTLGRMAFDMFRPTQLVCSVQGSFNDINIVDGTDEEAVKHVPKTLEADVREGKIPVRTYNIITAFTIEPYNPETMGPDSPNKGIDEPIQAIMTTNGFAMPYPRQNNRYSIWFSGGSIKVISDPNSPSGRQWEQIFSVKNMPQRTFKEKAGLFAAGLLMGASAVDEMDEEGKISFVMSRPIAAYIDMLYLDESLRIMRGSSGSLYVMTRAPMDDASSYYSAESLISSDSDCSSITMGSDFGCHIPSSPCASLLSPEVEPADKLLSSPDLLPSRPTRRGSIEACGTCGRQKDGKPRPPCRTCSSGQEDTHAFGEQRGGYPTTPNAPALPKRNGSNSTPTDSLPSRPTRRASANKPLVAPPSRPCRSCSPTGSEQCDHRPRRGRRRTPKAETNHSLSPKKTGAPSRPRRSFTPTSLSPPPRLSKVVATLA